MSTQLPFYLSFILVIYTCSYTIYLYPCLCRAFAPVYLLCYGYVLLLRLLCVVVVSLLCCWFLRGVVCVSMDRAFEPVEGSYLVRTFRSWVRPAVAVMLSVTRPLVLSWLCSATIIGPSYGSRTWSPWARYRCASYPHTMSPS